MLRELDARGERFDLVAGASSGSISGAVLVAGLASDGPDMFRAMASTPIVSSRYLRTDNSPFGMSSIVRAALARFIPEERITASSTELLVSTTRASRMLSALLRRSAKDVLGRLDRRRRDAAAEAHGHGSGVFAQPSPVLALARASDALTVHSNRTRSDMHEVIVASCTIPGLYSRLPVLDGEIHVDGGAADNTLLGVLIERGATDVTIVSPYADGAVSPTLFERERAPRVPPHVRLRLIWPERPIRLRHFDFEPTRLEACLSTPFVERVFEPGEALPVAREGAA